MPEASAPSARSHCAFGSTPASSRSVESLTPVHSAQDNRPWIGWTPTWAGSFWYSTDAVAGAFDEGDARLHRVAHQRLEREDQRTLDEAVDQKPMRFRIDVGNAGVMALEMKSVRRDRAVEQMMRRARGAGAGRSRRACKSTHNLVGIFRRLSVWRKGRAGRFHPRFDRQGFGRACLVRQRRASDRSRTGGQEEAAIKKSVSGGLFRLRSAACSCASSSSELAKE